VLNNKYWENFMTSFITAVKTALEKKQAAAHPDAKGGTSKTAKKTAPPVASGKPVRKAAGRGG